jgi:hypothetical protein
MGHATKDQQSRDRTREYAARLEAARDPVAVVARFAIAREARGNGGLALEEEFATTSADPDGPALPAAIWVALRQGDLDAVIDTLVQHATEQFLVTEHEQLDASYRITTVAESLGLPDVDRLIAQIAAFVQVPLDVVAMVCRWGSDDPRTLAEIERLMDQRYRTPVAPVDAVGTATHRVDDSPPTTDAATGAQANRATPANRATLAMSSCEFSAVLSLTPEQHAVLATLVRQADIVVVADEPRGLTVDALERQ